MASGPEQAPYGAMNVQVFAETVGDFGWVLRKRQDRNFPCLVCKKPQKGGHKHHGVDLLFTIDCPYTKETRGIYVDGKRYPFQHVTAHSQVKKWLTDSRIVARHLDESQKLFRDDLGLPRSTRIDTGIVAWECYEGWDEVKSRELKRKVTIASADEDPTHVFFFTKPYLDRLNSMREFKKQWPHLEFLYVVNDFSYWRSTLTPEQIVSNWWPFRYRRSIDQPWNRAIACFDINKTSEIPFLLPVLSFLQSTGEHQLEVHLPMGDSEISDIQAVIDATLKIKAVDIKLICKKFSRVEYKS